MLLGIDLRKANAHLLFAYVVTNGVFNWVWLFNLLRHCDKVISDKNAWHSRRPVSYFTLSHHDLSLIQKDQCAMDLSAVRTLKEPGKGGLSIIVHGCQACLDVFPLPFPAAQQITDFLSCQ